MADLDEKAIPWAGAAVKIADSRNPDKAEHVGGEII
jgi:hypothetical protein